MGVVISQHHAAHDLWKWQNCSPPWAPITHATPLTMPVSHLSGRCHLHSAYDGLFGVPRSLISDAVPAVQCIRYCFVKENYSIHVSIIIGIRSFKPTVKRWTILGGNQEGRQKL